LTGRENIYLNGAILGMSKTEIQKKFDEIVDFAEIEKFLDTPVKRYSSGMYVRLAFSVAAHLEPEILIIDEVLAVGDVQFQKKCLGKMDDIAKTGRTILFVSHNVGVVQMLCNRGIYLEKGAIIGEDTSANVVTMYLQRLEQMSTQSLLERTDRTGRGMVKFTQIEVTTGESDRITTLATGRPAYFIFHLTGVIPNVSCAFTIYDHLGQPVTYFDSAIHGLEDTVNSEEGDKFVCKIDELLLIPGRYRINASLMSGQDYEDDVKGAIIFEVEQGKIRGRNIPNKTGYGSIMIQHCWSKPI
jgi:lipopolysaccharide transport system ATP-binding protein